MNTSAAASRIKYVVDRATPGGTPSTNADDYWTEDASIGTPWVAIADMTNQPQLQHTNKLVTDAGIAAANLEVLSAGTLLFAMYASLGTTSVLGVSAATNQAILGLEPSSDTDLRFLEYWLIALRPSLFAYSRSNTQENLNAEVFGNLPFPAASKSDQHKIADFLDRETERIDALVDKKRRLIDLLKEKRTATITQAVTKGLDPTVPMKPSGIPWIGTIPAHWKEAQITRLAQLGSGHTPSRQHPEWWQECTIPWITTGEVSQMRGDRIEHIRETRELISEIGLANSAAEIHPTNTVVLSRTASAGFSAIMGADMATSQDFVTWTCANSLEPRFLLLCLRAMRRDLLKRLAQGSTHKTIYMPDIISIKIPVLPITEQLSIADWFWDRANSIDGAIDKITTQLSLLAEYREALITAAVTGEIDVDDFDADRQMARAS